MPLTFCGQGESQADTTKRRQQLTSSAKFSHERDPWSCLSRDPRPNALPSPLNIAESGSAQNI
ncbi:hypothetical protein E2C01_094218 [Portunus trituberculatus]|uniref:Uncharacterized protein n=1 Tax=Portunus trituberculatus TaxID=210409 RepID=A0A5B7JWK8_PORTR|nr:hypothetical protein [Portunus trituberculatus]